MSNIIGSAEAARLLGIDRSTLVRRVQSGTLTALDKLPAATGAYFFDRAVIESSAKQA